MLLLHSFEYEDAAMAFRGAQQRDSDFAMAYWGEAMTHNRPVWDQQDREAALAVLARYAPTSEARAAKAPTPRERAWLGAVDVLYGPGPKGARDTAYARAMERLVAAYPEDFEARAFHALSLLGLGRGSRDERTYIRAGAKALTLFDENPDHPGAAHYAIHSFDDPLHAPLGLRPARAYARIAPDAAHAQHMTSHVFLALGLWEELVAANERAAAVANREREARGLPPARCGHFAEWLLYGYLQLGRVEDAARLLRSCRAYVMGPDLSEFRIDFSSKLRVSGPDAPSSVREKAARSFARMRALYLADARTDASAYEADELPAPAREVSEPSDGLRSLMDLGTGFGAIRRKDRAAADAALERISVRGADDAPVLARYVPVWEGTLWSLLLAEEGDLQTAVEEARRAADREAALPVDYGPPLAAMPPRELEGELLLERNRHREAMGAFDRALRRTPRRLSSLLGYARAAASAGRVPEAKDAYRTVVEILGSEGADLPALEEARAFLEAHRDPDPEAASGMRP